MQLNREALKIPKRIYLNEPTIEEKQMLQPLQIKILNCFYTRHHDGFIRELSLKKIILLNDPWVMPFVLKLVGEYVIQILIVIKNNLQHLDVQNYIRFIKENMSFYNLIKQQVVSYWDCYYRFHFPNINDYAGFLVLDFFDKQIR